MARTPVDLRSRLSEMSELTATLFTLSCELTAKLLEIRRELLMEEADGRRATKATKATKAARIHGRRGRPPKVKREEGPVLTRIGRGVSRREE